jgi:hypothetical protein
VSAETESQGPVKKASTEMVVWTETAAAFVFCIDSGHSQPLFPGKIRNVLSLLTQDHVAGAVLLTDRSRFLRLVYKASWLLLLDLVKIGPVD